MQCLTIFCVFAYPCIGPKKSQPMWCHKKSNFAMRASTPLSFLSESAISLGAKQRQPSDNHLPWNISKLQAKQVSLVPRPGHAKNGCKIINRSKPFQRQPSAPGLAHTWQHRRTTSKRYLFSFGRKLLTDKNCLHFFWGPFSIQPIIFFVFVFSFSLFQRIGLENAVEGSWGVNLVNSLPKVHSKVH